MRGKHPDAGNGGFDPGVSRQYPIKRGMLSPDAHAGMAPGSLLAGINERGVKDEFNRYRITGKTGMGDGGY